MKSNEIRFVFSLSLLLALVACGGSDSSTKTNAIEPNLDLPQVVSEPPATGASGVAIDPTQKTVVIGNELSPGEEAAVENRLTVLEDETATTTAYVKEQIESIGTSAVPATASPAMVGDLETYKAQALETVKVRQRLVDQSRSGEEAP